MDTASSTALRTDHYELTMLAAALRDGTAGAPAVFEVFARTLPAGRRYGVFMGSGRLVDAIERFRFGDDELAFLRGSGFLDERTLAWLADYRFRGDVIAYREGELYFPWSPVVTVEAPFGDAVLLETIVLSILNHDTAVASAAARMVDVAGHAALIEMGGRRTHEEAAVAAARAAYLVGFAATSNLEAGRRYGIPTAGTAAHAFTLAHPSERAAFVSQVDALGVATTLLVDTYDIEKAIRTGVGVARERGASGPAAIRIDSGDLAAEARRARALLDDLGAIDTRIVVSGDLDEYLIEDLLESRAPIDSFGVGTRVVTGSGHPTANFVYKLVEIGGRPVAKQSWAKATRAGRKRAWRLADDRGHEVREVLVETAWSLVDDFDGEVSRRRALQVALMRRGVGAHAVSNEETREHHRSVLARLTPLCRMTAAGDPAMVASVADVEEP